MKKLQLIFLAAAILCIISVIASSAAISLMASRLDSQTVAARWSGDGTRTAHLSAFLSPEARLSASSIDRYFSQNLERGLINASISAPDKDARLFAYSYFAQEFAEMSLANEYGKTVKSGVSVCVSACGADYFLFHPLKMLSGYYFSTTDILNDCIVIDNDLAWQFFGSSDVVGKTLRLNGRDCYISGVCESGSDGDYAQFYGDKPRVFVAYSFVEQIIGELPVTAIEAVMSAPVGGFAMQIFKEALAADENYTEYIENSTRFDDESLYSRLANSNSRSVRVKPIAFPYWENTALKLTDTASAVYIFKLAPCIILSALALAEILIIYIKRRVILSAACKRITVIIRSIKQNSRRRRVQKGEDSQ